jgi:hypothetical protein
VRRNIRKDKKPAGSYQKAVLDEDDDDKRDNLGTNAE